MHVIFSIFCKDFFTRNCKWQKNLPIRSFKSFDPKNCEDYIFKGLKNSFICTKFVQIIKEGEMGCTVKAENHNHLKKYIKLRGNVNQV